jgi:hypothetical protein
VHWKDFQKRGNDVGDGGRPAIMSEEGLNRTVELITTSYRDGHPLSLAEIRSSLMKKKGIPILKDIGCKKSPDPPAYFTGY